MSDQKDKKAECLHQVAWKDMCASCGCDLTKLDVKPPTLSDSYVSMIHTVPDLKVSLTDARIMDKDEEAHLLQQRKLHLLVDLDQTLIHTTNDNIPNDLQDVIHFQLWGPMSPWYHTRLRPGTRDFLERISNLYQLHICTFGTRSYAHIIARHLDPDGKYFYNRILSRDECFSQNSKTANLKELFPNGDHMVCIIDDREDVWNFTPNLIHVKPYHFFRHTGDINAPPGLAKKDNDDKTGVDFSKIDNKKNGEEGKANEDDKTIAKSSDLADGKMIDNTKNGEEGTTNEDDKTTAKLSDLADGKISEVENIEGAASAESEDGVSVSDPKIDEEVKAADTADVSETQIKAIELNETKSDDNTASDAPAVPDPSEPSAVTDPSTDLSDVSTVSAPSDVQDSPSPKDVTKVEDQDDYLMYLEDILTQIHLAYYTIHDEVRSQENSPVTDVKNVIPYVRRKILKGCSIVFSGVVPVDHSLESSRAYSVALSLGAQVSDKIIPPSKSNSAGGSKDMIPTTHLVAARPGTAKVNDAKRYKNIHLVTPDWLWCCAERWDHVDEKLFSLYKKSSVRRTPPAHCSSPELSLSQQSNKDGGESGKSQEDDGVFHATGNKNKNGPQTPAARRGRTPSGRFMDTINPLMSFSMDEIESMGNEVDDTCNESESDSSTSADDEDTSASASNKTQLIPRRKLSRTQSMHDQETSHFLSKMNAMKQKQSASSDSEEDSSQEALCARKRKAKPETDTEDEPLAVKFRRGEPLPNDMDTLNLTNPSSDDEEEVDEDTEWMAQELERELLGFDESSQE